MICVYNYFRQKMENYLWQSVIRIKLVHCLKLFCPYLVLCYSSNYDAYICQGFLGCRLLYILTIFIIVHLFKDLKFLKFFLINVLIIAILLNNCITSWYWIHCRLLHEVQTYITFHFCCFNLYLTSLTKALAIFFGYQNLMVVIIEQLTIIVLLYTRQFWRL